jgi:putative ABC transport system substrate-binding protein
MHGCEAGNCVRRRDFIALVGAVAAWPLAAPMQQAAAAGKKMWHVGLLSNSPPPTGVTTTWRGEVLGILGQQGFEIGRNLELVERYSEGHADRLLLLARELDAASVDVIVAISRESVRAVLAATKTTPIVMVVGEDPVAMRIVASLARPGGRITGIVLQTSEGDVKRLQLLNEAIPHGRRFGYLGMSYEAVSKREALVRAADRLGVGLTMRSVDGPGDYEQAFVAMRNEGAAGVVIGANQPLAADAARVVDGAVEQQLPTMCEWDYMARIGCVFGFGHNLAYAQRRVGDYVARILKGAVPSELAVERSDAWKLTINLQAARRLGLTIPASLLARADEVIE